MNPRIVLLLVFLCLLFPPVGIPALLCYLAAKGLDALAANVQHKKMDAWSREEPWATGDEEADQALLMAQIRAAQTTDYRYGYGDHR